MQIDAGKMVLILEKAVDILNISIPWIPVFVISNNKCNFLINYATKIN